MNNCVAINILAEDKLLNERGMPLLFYWDGKQNISDALTSRPEFLEHIKKLALNTSYYTKTKVAYFYFTEDEDNEYEEVYNENAFVLQDWLTFKELDDADFALSYIEKILFDLYKKVFGTEYLKQSKDTLEEALSYIYDAIKAKYVQRISKQTFIEYIRVELNKTDANLSKQNMDWLVNHLNSMFGRSQIIPD